MDELISLADKQLEEQKVSLYGPQAPAMLSEDVADQRARKYGFALSDDPEAPPLDELRAAIQVGDDGPQRERALAAKQIQDIKARQEVIRKVIQYNKGAPMSREDTDLIMNVSSQSLPYTVDNIFEKTYAEKTSTAHAILAGAGSSEEEQQVMDAASNTISRRERFQKIAEDVQAKYQGMSGIEAGWDFAKTFLPFKSWWDIKHTINSKETVSSFLKGNAIEDIVSSYWLMPEEEAARKARQDIEDLASKNIYDAIALSQALLHFSSSEKFLENFNSGVDLATIPGLKMLKSAKNLVKATTTTKLDPAAILNATGNVEEAARATLMQKLEPKKLTNTTADFDIIKNDIPTLANPKAAIDAFNPTANLSREYASRLAQKLSDNAAQFMQQIKDTTIPVERLDRRTQAWRLAESEADARLQATYPQLQDGVLNVRTIFPEENAANVGYRQVELGMSIKSPSQKTLYVPIEVEGTPAKNTARGFVSEMRPVTGKIDELPINRPANQNLMNVQQRLEAARKAPPVQVQSPTTFKTAKGSEYTVLPDGSTRRNKALRNDPGHEGDQGIKPKSQRTFYVSDKDAVKLADFQAKQPEGVKVAIREFQDGRIGLYYTAGKDKGKFEKRTIVKPLPGPQVGATPIETWYNGSQVHFGNKIVSISRGQQITDPIQTIEGVKLVRAQRSKVNLEAANDVPKNNQQMLKVEIGKPDAKPFQSQQMADLYARSVYGLPKGAYEVQELAPKSYIIALRQAIDETAPTVRDKLAIETAWKKNDTTFIGRMLSAVRSGDVRIADEVMNQERKNATFGTPQFIGMIRKMQDEDIFSLKKNKDSFEKFQQFIETQRRSVKDGKVGRFSNTVSEFDTEWRQAFGRGATPEETTAYFAYTQMSNFDYVLRDLNILRDKTRLGMMEYGLPTVKNQKAGTPFFEGKLVQDIPEYQGYFPNIALWNSDPTLVRTLDRGDNPLTRVQVKELIASGKYKIIQLSPYSVDQIKNARITGLELSDWPIRYILTDDLSARPLRAGQLPDRPGGHIEHASQFYISQPNVRVSSNENINFKYSTYSGDNNLHAIDTRAEAEKFAKAYETARQMWKSKDPRFVSFVPDNLPYTPEELSKAFESGRINPDAPIMLREKNKSLWDTNPDYLRSNFVNLRRDTDDPHNLFQGQLDLAYATERNEPLTTIVAKGSTAAPQFAFAPARLIDPLSTMNRALADLVRGRWMEDIKIKTVEDFHAKFGDLLMGDSKQSFWNNPFKNLLDPVWAQTTDLERLQAAKNYRRAALEFLSVQNDEVLQVKNFKQSVLSTIKANFGENVYETAELWLLHRSNDPTSTVRNVAFTSTQGLFNPAVFLTQAMTAMNAIAYSPVNGMKAMAAMTLTQMVRYNDSPAHMAYYGKIAEAFGMKSSEFRESVELLKRSGMMDVGAEHSYLDTFKHTEIRKGKFGNFLDAGTIPFQEGERVTRITAWHTAYLDWKSANPNTIPTNRDIKWMMSRADDIGGNMTRASNAAWQQGLLSIPAQFQGYYARMLDQLWGNKLTPGEKARIFAMNSALYGVPTALGGYVAFWPVADVIREQMKKRGIDPDDNTVTKILDQGLLGPAVEVITGRKLDIGDKFGPGGQDWFRDLINQEDNIMYKVLGGVSGRTLMGYWESTYPMRAAFLGTIGYYPDYFPWKAKDLVNVFQDNISTLSNAAKAWGIISAHEYLTKRGDAVKDLPEWEGYLYALTGIKDARITDAFTSRQVLKDIDNAQREYKNLYIKDFRKALSAGDDYAQMAEYLKRANGWIMLGRFRPDEISRIQKEALAGKWQDLASNLDMKLAKERPEITEAWIKSLKGNR